MIFYMKKLTILMSVLMVAFTSVFAQSVTLNPNKAYDGFDERFFYDGQSVVDLNGDVTATVTLVDVESEDLELTVKGGEGSVFKGSFLKNNAKVKVSYTITAAKDSTYKDTVIVYKNGTPAVADSLFVSVKVTKKEKMQISVADASVFALGDVKLDKAEEGISVSSKLSIVEPRPITFEKAGTNPDNFDVSIAEENGDTLLKVTFTAEEIGSYSATVTLKAENAEDKVVNLSANVTMPDPVLSVAPAEWKDNVMIKGNNADAKKNFSIFGLYLQGNIKIDTQEKTCFTWDKTEYAVVFHATKADSTYKDTLVVTSPKAKTIKVPLEITVGRPVITAEDVDFNHVSLADAIKGTEKEAIVTVSPAEDWTFVVGGTNAAAFETSEKKDGKLIVKLKTNAIGIYSATVTIKAADAVDKVINLSAVVDIPAAELEVIPTEWKETIKLENNQAKAEHQISVNAVFAFSTPTVTLWKGNVGFAWDPANSKVTFVATAEGTYQDTLIVSVLGATGEIVKKVALEIKVEKGETPTPEVHVTSVTLNKTASDLAIGGTLQLTATVAPENATNKNVSWKSSDATIATVSAAGLVTGVKSGSATITVTTEDGGKTATCAITVKDGEVPPTPSGDAFALVTDASTLKAGMELIIVADTAGAKVAAAQLNTEKKYLESADVTIDNNTVALPENSTVTVFTLGGKAGEWTLANPDGKLLSSAAAKSVAWDGNNNKWTIAIAGGKATITCGESGSIQYNVQSPRFSTYTSKQALPKIFARTATPPTTISVTGVELDKSTASVEVGKSVTLTATVLPSNATNKKVTWSSSNEAVATVAEGVVTGKAEGTATITVTTVDGAKTATCVVTVTKNTSPIVAVTGVKLDKTSYEIMEGLPVTLVATVEPADATNKDVTWSSSDETVATVENGLVTTLQPGTATITVKTVDGGFTATCVITVNRESPPLPSSMSFTKVTADQEDWTGQYILVYEKSASEALVFNGKDAAKGEGCIAATIASGKITLEDYAKLVIYVEKITGGYSLKIGDNYMGGKDATNGITFSNQPIANTFKYADSLTIASNNVYMRFNTTADQMRFRYYKNAGYGKPVAIYKSDQKIDPQPAWVPDTISVAEAIAVCSQEKTHYVKGIVGEILSTAEDITKYHNIDFMLADMSDASKQIKCFRLWWQKMSGEFTGNEIATGDTILVYGQTTIYTDSKGNKTNEIANGYVVEILGKGDGTGPVGPTPHGEELDIDYAEAAYIVDEEGPFWMLYAGKYPADEAQEYLDYPQIILLIDNPDGKHIAGQFDIFEGSVLYLNDNDSIEFVSGTVTVTCLEEGNELYPPYYKFVAVVFDAQGKQYAYEFETEVYAYDYDTDEDIALEDKATQGIENTVVFEFDPNAPIYNIQGMQVDRNTRGILIQNGHKFIIAQ